MHFIKRNFKKAIQLVNALVIISVFVFSMPYKVIIIIVTEFMFLGIDMFWVLLKACLAPA